MGNMARGNGGMVVGSGVGPHSHSGGAEAGRVVFGTRGIGIGTGGGEEPELDPPRLAGAGGRAGDFFRSPLCQ